MLNEPDHREERLTKTHERPLLELSFVGTLGRIVGGRVDVPAECEVIKAHGPEAQRSTALSEADFVRLQMYLHCSTNRQQ